MTLKVLSAKALYSSSVEEQATVRCFLDFQDIGVFPKKTRWPPIDLWSLTLSAQSASLKPYKKKDELRVIWKPKKIVPLR